MPREMYIDFFVGLLGVGADKINHKKKYAKLE